MKMGVINITDDSVDKVIKDNKIVLVDFWAPWCGPCRMIAPVIEQLSKEIGDQAVIAKLNVDENPYGAIKYQIQGIPAIKLFHNVKEAAAFVGVQPLSVLKQAILQAAK